jgi:glycogen(starch) synthase
MNLVAIRSFLLKRGIPCSVINITRHRKPDADEVYYPIGPAQVMHLLSRLSYDVIHLHIGGMLNNRLLALSLVCAQWPGKKSVLTFHSGGFPSTPEGQAMGPSSFTGFVLRHFDGVIGVNEEIVRFLHKMGVRPERTRLISPYAFVAGKESESLLPPALEDFFGTHDPVLMSVGLLEPEYDLPIQIVALTPIRQKFQKAGLLLIGSGSLEASLRETIASSPSVAHILLAGDVAHSATMEAVLRSRLMLRTTLYDGDALSVREALQLGTPVIATDNGMRPAGARLIPKSDLQALLRAIEQELDRPTDRKEVSSSDERNLQAVFDFYRDLVEGKIK